jgi:hypothetical protein
MRFEVPGGINLLGRSGCWEERNAKTQRRKDAGEEERRGMKDRGREVRLSRTPLPPNRTGGFPAYGSPVSSVPDGIVRNDCGPPAD